MCRRWLGEAVRERRWRRRGGLERAEGAPRKIRPKSPRSGDFLNKNRDMEAYFQIFFACGALNLAQNRFTEPTPYREILRSTKTKSNHDFTMHILGCNHDKSSVGNAPKEVVCYITARRRRAKNFNRVPPIGNFGHEIPHNPPPSKTAI